MQLTVEKSDDGKLGEKKKPYHTFRCNPRLNAQKTNPV